MKKLIPILAVMFLVGLALVGWLWSGARPRPELPDETNVLPEAPAQVELAEVAVSTNSVTVGENQRTTIELLNQNLQLSALSLSLTFEYQSQPPIEVKAEPFELDADLAEAGWQVLINRLVNDDVNKQLTVEVALGKIGGKDLPDQITSGLLGEINFATTREIGATSWQLNAASTRVIDDQGQSLPVKLIAEPFAINQVAEPPNGENE